jgi:hypothetical protein
VSFYNVEVSNPDPAYPEDVEGYFTKHLRHSSYRCEPYAGGSWISLWFNAPDSAKLGGEEFRPPWSEGSFVCVRPWRYRIDGDPREYELAPTGRYFAVTGPQRGHDPMDGKKPGTLTIEEAGACVSRAPDGESYPCT